MNITVRKFTAKDTKDWDDFVNNSNNGTLFHLRSFLSYHIDRKFNDHSLLFEKKGKLIAVFPATYEKLNEKNVLYSHPGASFGGFIYSNLSYDDIQLILEKLEEYSLNNNFDVIFFVDTPSIYTNYLNETFEYLVLWQNYIMKEYYISSIIDLNGNSDPLDFLHSRKKRYIKKYTEDQDLTIKWENNFEQFYPILLQNKSKHNVKPTHSLDELKKLNELHPHSFHLLLLYQKDKVIGGTLNFIINNNCGMIFYNMIDYNFINLQPATIQIYESIKWAKRQKLNYLDLGVSQQPNAENPLSPHPTLINFKEQMGAKSVIRKAFQKTIQ